MAHNAVIISTVASSSGATRLTRTPSPISTTSLSDVNSKVDPSDRRRQSTSFYSAASGDDESDEETPLSALDSSAALILVHDSEDSSSPFEFSDDEDGRDEDDELVSPMFELRDSAVFPPLPPSLVFLYLLSPYLRLGALNLPYSNLPLKFGLPALLLSALGSVFARQIWYMLARYLRKAKVVDILLDTFARGRGKEQRRALLRAATRTVMRMMSVLMSIIYLRYSMYNLIPLMVQDGRPVLSYVLSTLLVNIILSYFSYGRALDFRRIVYVTWLSIVSYTIWLGLVIYAHTKGTLQPEPGWLGSSKLWPGLATVLFTLCSSNTLPLYASLKSSSQPGSRSKTSPTRSFRLLSFSSGIVAVLLLLPSIIFSAFPNRPATAYDPSQQPFNMISNITDTLERSNFNATHVPILSTQHILPELSIPQVEINNVIRVFASTTLLLSIPSVMATTPPIAIPLLRSAKMNVSRILTIFVVLICTVIPPSTFQTPGDAQNQEPFVNSSHFFGVITLIVLLMAYTGTYFVPTFLHVSQHFFKRPLAIVVPPRAPHLRSSSALDNADRERNIGSPNHERQGSSSNPRIHDELLLRKERALQRRQLKRRIIWDVGVWLLFGSSVAGVVGYAGHLVSVW